MQPTQRMNSRTQSHSHATAPVYLIVPPLIRYSAGPLLGPAMLAGAAARAGVDVRVIDANNAFLRQYMASDVPADWRGPTGDHAKVGGAFDEAQQAWNALMETAFGSVPPCPPGITDPVSEMCFSFDEVEAAVARLADQPALRAWLDPIEDRPRWVGVSVMFAGQVPVALAVSREARRRWPGVPVVWGGAHVTLLADEIALDPRYGKDVDAFIAGYAEQTFVELCAMKEPHLHPDAIRAGTGRHTTARGDIDVAPRFDDLGNYGHPRLTLPAQTSRGCSYGRCEFCTYPIVEGAFDPGRLTAAESVIATAQRTNASIAFKDALMLAARLDAVGDRIDGSVEFAVTTRVRPRLGRQRMRRLAEQGLRTVELGIESTTEERLHALGKRQVPDDFAAFLEDVVDLPVHVVANVMFGFPGQTLDDALAELDAVEQIVARAGGVNATTERNLLQVQRRSPLAARAADHGIRILRAWPWATSLSWDAPAWREDAVGLQGHFGAGGRA